MTRTCETCKFTYDDAKSTTICPHEQFISDETAAQKDLAFSLLGKYVVFVEFPNDPGLPPEGLRVESVNWNGLVSLRGILGSFAPSLFVVKS